MERQKMLCSPKEEGLRIYRVYNPIISQVQVSSLHPHKNKATRHKEIQ